MVPAMATWAGPLLAAAVLLVIAAVPKVRYPDDAVRALRSTGLPGTKRIVRALGAAEAGVGAYALLAGNRVSAVLVALSYLGFSGFVLLARTRSGVVSSCGCFGQPDTPPTRAHVLVTLLLAGGALGALFAPVGPVSGLFHEPVQAVALVMLTAVCIGLAYLALAVLPTVALASENS
jgi:hypothetical protein